MSVTSFSFLALLCAGVPLYYLVPKRWQWVELLVLSLVFYFGAGTPATILYVLASTLIAYASTMYMDRLRKSGRPSKLPFRLTVIAIVLNVLIWFVVKGRGFWAEPLYRLAVYTGSTGARTLAEMDLIAALGMGYYTLQILGYIIDCYWENITPQKNPLKLFLFTAYFPQMTTGPISRYAQLTSLYEGHSLKYRHLTFGAQRILWGFVKKIVLAERVGVLVSAITDAPDTYTGFYSWIAILLYPVQMYADFSGCMDIVLGASEMFGIRLAENFRNPFFSRTSQEFWQRWHITLGTWAKDYVLYPLLKSKGMVRFSKKTRKRFGKKTGKFLTNAVGMFFLWMVMGVWHGGYRYVVGVSLWYWIILMAGNLLEPVFKAVVTRCGMKTESFSWHLFQSARTYCIYAIGAAFFNVGVSEALALLKDALKVFYAKGSANPWIFFDGSLLELGVTWSDLNVILLVTGLLLAVAFLREKYEYARNWIAAQSFVFRWSIWIVLFVFVLVWGKYGPGYSAAEFIYKGF